MDYNERRKKEKLNKAVATNIAIRRMNEKKYIEYKLSQRTPTADELATKEEDMELGKQAYFAGIRHTDEELRQERFFFEIGYYVAGRIDYARNLDKRKNDDNLAYAKEAIGNIVKKHR